VLHFWWVKAGKNLLAQPILFTTIVAALLLMRILSQKNRQQLVQLFSRRDVGAGAGAGLVKESK
jgi:sulfoxide reductase heme-binding subunit YedZ